MKRRDAVLLFVLAALWGASFLFVRIAVPVLGPFPLVAARVLLGGSILLVYATLIHQLPDWRSNWLRYALIGLFNNAIPFTLIAAAQLHLTASYAALLNATTPLFSAVIAAIWIKERLTTVKISGLVLGMIGVAIVVGWEPDALDSTRVVSIALMLGATLSYGIAAVYGKVAFKKGQPIATATGQLLSSTVLMLPLALLNPPQHPIQPVTVAAVVGLALLSTSIAYIIYFHLIGSSGPTIAASVTLLIPFFSSLWGAIFLSEQLQTNEVLGFLVILVGLCLVTGLWKQLWPKRQPLGA
ncbi:MAG: DMT family transporter [Anaerolineae bacterium]|nr:DMT family transporter [Anaerolineae bacterium]